MAEAPTFQDVLQDATVDFLARESSVLRGYHPSALPIFLHQYAALLLLQPDFNSKKMAAAVMHMTNNSESWDEIPTELQLVRVALAGFYDAMVRWDIIPTSSPFPSDNNDP